MLESVKAQYSTTETSHLVHLTVELPDTPSPALLAQVANEQMFGKEYAASRSGMRQVRGSHNLTPAGRANWRDKHVCKICHTLLPITGICGYCVA